MPPVAPTAFHLGIWTGVPAGTNPASPWGHPEELVWEKTADDWTWEFAGYEQSAGGEGTYEGVSLRLCLDGVEEPGGPETVAP